jgi:hypothetical protein
VTEVKAKAYSGRISPARREALKGGAVPPGSEPAYDELPTTFSRHLIRQATRTGELIEVTSTVIIAERIRINVRVRRVDSSR